MQACLPKTFITFQISGISSPFVKIPKFQNGSLGENIKYCLYSQFSFHSICAFHLHAISKQSCRRRGSRQCKAPGQVTNDILTYPPGWEVRRGRRKCSLHEPFYQVGASSLSRQAVRMMKPHYCFQITMGCSFVGSYRKNFFRW